MTLYIFITHQKNIKNCYQRISEMMSEDFLIVQGGFSKDSYDEKTRILNLNCNDAYKGLPEKVMKTFHFIVTDERFYKYTQFCKLDDDMQLVRKIENQLDDYCGFVHYGDGNRNWHMGRCGNFWDQVPYLGEFVPWCMGGYGYIISRNALEKITPDFDYLDHIYEDVYIGSILRKKGVNPSNIDLKKYFYSPEH